MTTTQEQAQEAAAQAKDKAGEAAQQAKGKASDQARAQVDQRSTQAGEQVSSQASDVRSVAEALREKGQDKPAELAEKAAGHAERLGSYLQDSDADTILADLEDLGRKQPMAVIFGGLALGFAASRFLKASSEERSRSPRPTPAPRPAIPATTGTGAAGVGRTGVGATGTAGTTPPPVAPPIDTPIVEPVPRTGAQPGVGI